MVSVELGNVGTSGLPYRRFVLNTCGNCKKVMTYQCANESECT